MMLENRQWIERLTSVMVTTGMVTTAMVTSAMVTTVIMLWH